MKSKSRMKSSLFLLGSWNLSGLSRPVPGGFSAGHGICRAVHCLVLAVVLSLPLPPLYAQESGALLENITFDRETTTRETISFKLNGPHIPKIFAVKGDSPKVVFDFYDTRHSASIKGVMKSRGNLVSAIRTGMHTAPELKTRVVLDLVPAADYDFAQDFRPQDNTLIITIFHAPQSKDKPQKAKADEPAKKTEPAPVKEIAPQVKVKKEAAPVQPVQVKKVEPERAASPAVSPKKSSVPASSQLVINGISFAQSPDKGEKVSFSLTNFHPPVVFGIEEGTPSIVCDFIDAGLGEKVPEIIAAKGRFVKQVRVEKLVKLHKIRVILELVPNRHYDLQQIFFKEEGLYVLFVNADESADAGSRGKP